MGLNVGVNNLWIAIATILYCFDIAEDAVSGRLTLDWA